MTSSELTKSQNDYTSVDRKLFTDGAQDTTISLNPSQHLKPRSSGTGETSNAGRAAPDAPASRAS